MLFLNSWRASVIPYYVTTHSPAIPVAPWDPCFLFFFGGEVQEQYFFDKLKHFSDKSKIFPDDNILNLHPPPVDNFDNFRQHSQLSDGSQHGATELFKNSIATQVKRSSDLTSTH